MSAHDVMVHWQPGSAAGVFESLGRLACVLDVCAMGEQYNTCTSVLLPAVLVA